MPLLTVSPGVRFEYLDSGNESPNVLVIVHGHSWGAGKFIRDAAASGSIDARLGSFQKCIDRAKQYDLRIIAVNRRGFSQSTRLTEYDLRLLNSKIKDNHTIFLEDRARELAQVLVILGTTTGNHARITLLGWSLGNVFCLKMVEMMEANALGALNLQLQRLMSDYIIYDVPYWGLGMHPPIPEGGSYGAQILGSSPRRRRHLALNHWLSAYFRYPENDSSVDAPAWVLMDKMGNMDRPTTAQNIINEGCFGALDLEPDEITGESRAARKSGYTPGGTRDDNSIQQCIASGAFKVSPEKVLFTYKEKENESRLPITMLWGECSTWILRYAAWVIQQSPEFQSGEMRLRRMLRISDGNHFSHWDVPDTFLQKCLQLMKRSIPSGANQEALSKL